ncbi:MAG TPA: ATP-binding protein [Bacteroidota bacterium]|nr:ATP-binding protein [Bacteroidota bacterium]
MSTSPSASIPVEKQPSALTILVVDDVEENLELLQDLFTESGYNVIAARSGVEAFEVFNRETVHLIIADAMMPRMDGFQLCRKVKENPKNAKTPFIIYTGNYVDEEDQELARNVGVDRYVMKYAGLGSLIEAVRDVTLQNYGIQPEQVPESSASIDDQSFLEKHHTLVTKKLEEKMKELEMYAATLARKNRELQVSELRYRALFENASVAIFVVDSKTESIVDVNNQGIALLGYSKDELLGLPSLPFIEGDPFNASLSQSKDIVAQEAAMKTKDGDSIDVDVSAGSVSVLNDSRVMLFVRDITEQKKIRNSLMQMEKMSLMGRLAAGIAHEIRNPLAGVTLNLQYLQRKIDKTSPDFESIAAALEGAERIQHVIEDTLGLARVTPPSLQQHSINAIIARSLHFVSLALQQKAIALTTSFDENVPDVMVDQKQIQQVMLNILQNAIDATPPNGAISVSTKTGEMHAGEAALPCVETTIQDSGVGIPVEMKAVLFEPFRTTKSGGTGLGLALSKYIIGRHHGDIALESPSEGGTLVRIILPSQPTSNGAWNG